MKLYEFVDKLYEMGDMESPETIGSKKTLNESLNEASHARRSLSAIVADAFEGSRFKNVVVSKERGGVRVDFDRPKNPLSEQTADSLAEKIESMSGDSRISVYPDVIGDNYVIFDITYLNESLTEDVDEVPPNELYTRLKNAINSVLDDPSLEDDYDTQTIEELRYLLINKTLLPDFKSYADFTLTEDNEDDLDEGVLGGLAGAAIGGLAGNSLGHPILGAIGGGLAGSAIQNALNDDLDEALDDIVSVDVDFNIDDGEDFDEIKNYLKDKFNIDVVRYDPDGLYDNITLQGSKENLVKYLSTDYSGYDEDDPDIEWVEEFFPELLEDLNEDKDLSTVKRSMTRVLQDNREKIDNCSTPQEVHDVVAGLLAEAGMDTPATRKLLMNLDKSRSLTNSLQTVYNSILKGSGLGVM